MADPVGYTPKRISEFAMVGANGCAFVADKGTEMPTGLAIPGAGYNQLGALSDDGVNEGVAESSTSFTPFGTTTPWLTVTNSSVRTFQFTCWEVHNPHVISLWERIPVASLSEDETTNYVEYETDASPEPDRRTFLLDMFYGKVWHRYYLPEGEVSDRGNVVHKQTEQKGYQFTVTAYPDSDGKTVYHRIWTPARQSDLLS